MNFNRTDLARSVADLERAPDASGRCLGFNYRVEENVSDARRDQLEIFDLAVNDVRELVDGYFKTSVQGLRRNHRSSTFDYAVNADALLPVTIEPNQKIIRLERIDALLNGADLDFDRLKEALRARDSHGLAALTDHFSTFPGERPAFAAFKSEVEPDLAQPDWLQRLIDRLGLLHHYPIQSEEPYSFALMEYTATEVIRQAAGKNLTHSFALATVLECRNNPAFFPVPKGSGNGFTVDLRERAVPIASVREVLHARFDFSWNHVQRLERWTGADTPDIEAARVRHLASLREGTGRRDFGELAS